MSDIQIVAQESAEGLEAVSNAYRPLVSSDPANRVARIKTNRGIMVNSMLRRDEWAAIDAAVIQEARYPLRAVNDLVSRGLLQRLTNIGTMVTDWYVSSEVNAATVNMSGTGGNRDLPDLKKTGAPVPVVFKDFGIDARSLAASRSMGDGIDVTAAAEASRVVAETLESLLVNGSSTQLNGAPLYGYRNHPDRNTDTASNYGGGDWGTIANIVDTVAGMINAAMADRHYGPYMLYANPTQFNEAAFSFYDSTDESALMRIRSLPQIAGFEYLPSLAAGELLLIQMTRNVIEWAETLSIQVREWVSGDGMSASFKVLAIAAPKVKSTYDGRSGIVHATGA